MNQDLKSSRTNKHKCSDENDDGTICTNKEKSNIMEARIIKHQEEKGQADERRNITTPRKKSRQMKELIAETKDVQVLKLKMDKHMKEMEEELAVKLEKLRIEVTDETKAEIAQI